MKPQCERYSCNILGFTQRGVRNKGKGKKERERKRKQKRKGGRNEGRKTTEKGEKRSKGKGKKEGTGRGILGTLLDSPLWSTRNSTAGSPGGWTVFLEGRLHSGEK